MRVRDAIHVVVICKVLAIYFGTLRSKRVYGSSFYPIQQDNKLVLYLMKEYHFYGNVITQSVLAYLWLNLACKYNIERH
jgi:hypothetical protein